MLESVSKNVVLGGQITQDAIDSGSRIWAETGSNRGIFTEAMESLGRDLVHPKFGKMTKRLPKWIKKHYNLEMPNKALSEIGNLFTESAVEKLLHVVILPDTCFQPGIFGDDDACFFKPEYTYYRKSIDLLNGKGVCFFEDGKPLARCWLIENPETEDFLAFNIYTAYRMSLSFRQAAEALLNVLDLQYCKRMYWGSNYIYVNNNKVYVLSNHKYTRGTYEMAQPSADRRLNSCRDCGAFLEPRQKECDFCGGCMKHGCYNCGEDIDGEDYVYNGHHYCEECFYERYSYCDGCGEAIDRDDSYHVEDYGNYCESCWNRRFRTCDSCEEDVHRDNVYWARNRYGDEIPLCEYCRDSNYTYCEVCGDYYPNDDVADFDGKMMCNHCYDRHTATCFECGKTVWKADAMISARRGAGSVYECDECWDKLEAARLAYEAKLEAEKLAEEANLEQIRKMLDELEREAA